MSSMLAAFIIPLLTLFTYFFSENPATESFRTQIIFTLLFGLLFYVYFTEKTHTVGKGEKIASYLLAAFVLFLVSATGWFMSPFSFTLYFLVLVLSFVFTPMVAIIFVGSLLTILFLKLEQTNISDSFLTIVSLLFSIPITLYLRERYLGMKQTRKEILILKGRKNIYTNKVGEVLENKINLFATNLRQPISDIKHLIFRLQSITDQEKVSKIKKRISFSAEQALQILKQFEEESTGKKLVTMEKKSEPSSPTRQA